jgi:hypothetical protein
MLSRRSLVIALALVGAPAAAHPLEQDRLAAGTNVIQIEQEIMAFRAALVQAIRAKDAAKLRDMYTVGYTQTHGSGRTDGRDKRILSLIAGDPVIETVPPVDLVIRVYGPGVAIATGKSTIPDRRGDYDVKWIAVYVKLEDGWKLASTQATKVGASS